MRLRTVLVVAGAVTIYGLWPLLTEPFRDRELFAFLDPEPI